MALLRPRYLSGLPQRRWIVLCLFLLFAFMTYGTSRAIEAASDLGPVQTQTDSAHFLSEGHPGHPCNPGDRDGKDHAQCNCTFGPGCSFIAVVSETAVAAASFKLSLIQTPTLPPVNSQAVRHFRPPEILG